MNKETTLRLGVIGLSPGNGHPYSWSAICNGYDPEAMASCPFPVIPLYLAEQSWPEARIPGVEVTHIWTQDQEITEDVARASRIPNRCQSLEEMIGQVDAVLLARDDAEQHRAMSEPFLKAGLPVFIDKPLALSQADAHAMLGYQTYDGQLFSCSSLKFAQELLLTEAERAEMGEIYYVEAQTPKYWDTYAVHLLDPLISNIPNRGKLVGVRKEVIGKVHVGQVEWTNLRARIATYSGYTVPLQFTYFGEHKSVTKVFSDSFQAFKTSIQVFLQGIRERSIKIPREETLEIVSILEQGR